jgi:hypothetical protein
MPRNILGHPVRVPIALLVVFLSVSVAGVVAGGAREQAEHGASVQGDIVPSGSRRPKPLGHASPVSPPSTRPAPSAGRSGSSPLTGTLSRPISFESRTEGSGALTCRTRTR